MRRLFCHTLAVLLIGAAGPTAHAQPTPDTTWTTFAPGALSLPGIRETSPSITADGQTLAFARTEGWRTATRLIASAARLVASRVPVKRVQRWLAVAETRTA